jgi:hypothetical protein
MLEELQPCLQGNYFIFVLGAKVLLEDEMEEGQQHLPLIMEEEQRI